MVGHIIAALRSALNGIITTGLHRLWRIIMNDRVKPLVHELKEGLIEMYGERLQGVYLYGSYARGEADSDSDVDVLIVLDQLERYGAEIERTSHLVAALSLEYEISVSRVFVSQKDWADRKTPFLANAREEAIPA
jgi:predicted nucleotidyltransferase